ncbi:MAG: hypothetical protein JXR71_13095 [Bacteroidales bacterium]|nr:hypothetical protein [Bacteroidales bacterium]
MIKKVIGILLIAGALATGYYGIHQLNENSGASLKIGNVELGVTNTKERNQDYVYLGIAVLLLGGGIYVLTKK